MGPILCLSMCVLLAITIKSAVHFKLQLRQIRTLYSLQCIAWALFHSVSAAATIQKSHVAEMNDLPGGMITFMVLTILTCPVHMIICVFAAANFVFFILELLTGC